ncbi:hypothetical protein IE53DRAFT_81487 [Violaceomyces palustris]|uniref:Uncharacterized protein n=1 Tax=Violaceomyces palustris TaxID=1673888 RepID=A0ACD0NY57_9BASI|nr:hypothetical protein IE53DRAFT_81487 [Violaceomyces palustris]
MSTPSPTPSPSTPKTPHTFSPFRSNSSNKGSSTTPTPSTNSNGGSNPPTLLLSRSNETTYHRRLRGLLQEFFRSSQSWEQVVSFEGIKWATEVREAWTQVESLHSSSKASQGRQIGSEGSSPRVRRSKFSSEDTSSVKEVATRSVVERNVIDPFLGPGGQKERMLAESLARIERAEEGLDEVESRLNRHLNKMTSTSESVNSLLLEAAKSKGPEFCFLQPMWGTWPMDRFVSTLSRITSQYVVSTRYLEDLIPCLCSSKPTSSIQLKIHLRGQPTPSGASGGGGKTKADDLRRLAFEEWVRLPFLELKGNNSRRWFEQVCEVEVGRWSER